MVDPTVYNNIFEKNRDGQEVLAELCRLFYDKIGYAKGDDALSLAFSEGQRSVIHFILNKTGQVLEVTGHADGEA